MAKFIVNPKFKTALMESAKEFSKEYAQLCRNVIETERLWRDWETSNPLRDIVDSGDLNESMTVEQIDAMSWRIAWSTAYVVYVFFGYTLASGRRIPARQWTQIAIDENNLLEIFRNILVKNLK